MHGGFFFGVTALYLRTRNGRFFYLPLFGYLLMLISALTSSFVQSFQLRHGLDYLGYLVVCVVFAALLSWCMFLLVRVKATIGISRKPSAEKIHVPNDRRLLVLTRRLKFAVYLECLYYVVLMLVTGLVRVRLAIVEETPLFQFLQGFVMSYTMSLHRAFILGTGYSGAVKGDRRLLLIFFFANVVFALFFAMNLLAKLVEGVFHRDPEGLGAGLLLAQVVVLLISAYFAFSLNLYLKAIEEDETLVSKKVCLSFSLYSPVSLSPFPIILLSSFFLTLSFFFLVGSHSQPTPSQRKSAQPSSPSPLTPSSPGTRESGSG